MITIELNGFNFTNEEKKQFLVVLINYIIQVYTTVEKIIMVAISKIGISSNISFYISILSKTARFIEYSWKLRKHILHVSLE